MSLRPGGWPGALSGCHSESPDGSPPALIQELASAGPASVLDGGSGTGKLAVTYMGSAQVLAPGGRFVAMCELGDQGHTRPHA